MKVIVAGAVMLLCMGVATVVKAEVHWQHFDPELIIALLGGIIFGMAVKED